MDNVKDTAHLDLEELAQRRAEVYLSEQFFTTFRCERT